MERAIGDIDLVVASSRYRETDVVAGAADQRALGIDELPLLAGVVRSPYRALILGLNERIDAVGVGRCDGDVDLAEGSIRQTVTFESCPLGSAIVGDINPTLRTAAIFTPGVQLHLPYARYERVWIVRIHGQSRAAGVLASEQHPRPVLAAVGRAINTTLLLRSGRASQHAREYDVRIRGVHDDAANAAGLRQAQVCPGAPGVGGLVDAVAHHVAVADDPGFARACPHGARL